MFESQCIEIYDEFVMSDEVVIHYVFNSLEHTCLMNMDGGDLLICEFVLN